MTFICVTSLLSGGSGEERRQRRAAVLDAREPQENPQQEEQIPGGPVEPEPFTDPGVPPGDNQNRSAFLDVITSVVVHVFPH